LNSAEYRFRLPIIGSVLHKGEPSLTICPKNGDHLSSRPSRGGQRASCLSGCRVSTPACIRTDSCERCSAGSRDGGARSRTRWCLVRLLLASRRPRLLWPYCNPLRNAERRCSMGRRLQAHFALLPAPNGGSATVPTSTSERTSAMSWDSLAPGPSQDWGSGGYRDRRVGVIGWLELLSKAGTERAIIDGAPNLKQQIGPASRPTHLL